MDLLLIDDEDTIGPMVEGIMQNEVPQARVQQALDCESGLSELNKRKFDCVVLDHGMANINGLACLKLIRNRFNDMPVVVLTGEIDDQLRAQYMTAGADEYVVKPFLSQLFAPIVKGAIEGRKKLCDALKKKDSMLSDLRRTG